MPPKTPIRLPLNPSLELIPLLPTARRSRAHAARSYAFASVSTGDRNSASSHLLLQPSLSQRVLESPYQFDLANLYGISVLNALFSQRF